MIPEIVQPYPPRYWWLKRIAIAFVAVVLLLTIARLWWGYDANRRLQAEIAAIRARGEPILPEDFNTPPIPDAENAAYYIKQAIAAINPAADPPAATATLYANYLPLPDEWYTVAKKAVEGNQAALQFARQARQHTKVDWGLKFTTPVFMTTRITGLNQQRHLASLLGDTALYKHLTGKDIEALEHLRDLLALVDAVDQQPLLISHLVAIGIKALAVHRLHVISPGLRLENDDALRNQARTIIALLLGPQEAQGARRAMETERMVALDQVNWSASKSIVLRPMYDLDALRSLHMYEAAIAAMMQPTLPTAQRLLASHSSTATSKPSPAQMLTSTTLPWLNSVILTDFRIRGECHMAAVSLAARMYQADHAGQWPPNLESLVPQYLPAVPVDPFSPTGTPLKYLLAENGRRPIVYSVGEDGRDDTIAGAALPPEPQYDWYGKSPDEWRDISRFEPPPTTQPAEN